MHLASDIPARICQLSQPSALVSESCGALRFSRTQSIISLALRVVAGWLP